MEFRHLSYFQAIVAAGSVSGAAKELGMSQPPLSATITKLENELGVKLLKRTSQGVEPTAAGLHLLERGQRLIAEREQLTHTLSLMGKGKVGELRLGVEPMVINEIIADALAEITLDTPQVRIRMVDLEPEEVLTRLKKGELDLACVPFSRAQFAVTALNGLTLLPVVSIPLKIAVPSSRAKEHHPLDHGWGRWILPRKLRSFTGMPEIVKERLKDDETFEVLEVSTPQSAMPLVSAGVGVAPTTQRIAAQWKGVAALDAPAWLPPMQATLIWRSGIEMTPTMRRFVDTIKQIGAVRKGALGPPSRGGATNLITLG
ncbi:LysR family transcriptional regulator [Enteractinococcus helveticum]|uniref:Transcriptional regulator n=1 Tax=Enteractinococcus helveticum TaxID=1837282 RepID=A0A1B7LVB3_9MICC|nr:LysR family transcriptional regulator [Enteractinococcus helveticum]OAV52028.1 transcriptional regulator [Enteractinococcus helveticum]